MRKFILTSAALAALTLAPGMAVAAVVTVEPEVDTWVMTQPDTAAVTIDGNIAVGTVLPDTVTVMEVPKHDKYSFAVVNKKRVVVDRQTRKIVKVY